MLKALLVSFFALSSSVLAGEKVDLALVLAVDCSGSVDGRELRLQLDGIASALRDPEIIAAATSGPYRRIAVNLMLWADPDEQRRTTGWIVIDSSQASQNFSDTVKGFNYLIGGGTGLGAAVAYGISLIRNSNFEASREVVDVSGDGRESWELREPRFLLADARALRGTTKVVVNGLAITQDVPDLADYYSQNVVGGPGSFVITANTYESFAEAMRIKLLREILPNVASIE